MKPGGTYYQLVWSENEAPGPGPRRISKEEIYRVFNEASGWKVRKRGRGWQGLPPWEPAAVGMCAWAGWETGLGVNRGTFVILITAWHVFSKQTVGAVVIWVMVQAGMIGARAEHELCRAFH